MKLHLPKLLRNAVLACITAVAGISTTVGTAAFTGGVASFMLVAPQAMADVHWIGTSDTYEASAWHTQANWDTPFAVGNKGPGVPDSNLWQPIFLDDVTIGSASDRVAMEGWNIRLNLDNGAALYATSKKFQSGDGGKCHMQVNGGSTLDINILDGSFHAATFDVGAGSSITFGLTQATKNTSGLTINLNGAGAQMNFVSAVDGGSVLTGTVNVNAELNLLSSGEMGTQEIGLTVENIELRGLSFNFGSQYTLSDTEITAANAQEKKGQYWYYLDEQGKYHVTYVQYDHINIKGGNLTWNANTLFDGVAWTENENVDFTTADSVVTMATDVTARLIEVKDNLHVSIGGDETLTAERVIIGAGAQLSILSTSALSTTAISMDAEARLNIATGGVTTVQEALGSATWTGGSIGVTNGTTLNLSDSILNSSNIVVDGVGSKIVLSNCGDGAGEVYLGGNIKLQNGAIMELSGDDIADGTNYDNANKYEILSNSELRMGTGRFSINASDQIILNNGKITGAGEGSNGAIDFFGNNAAAVVSDGTSSIESIRMRNGSTVTYKVQTGTLTIASFSDSANKGGNLVKTGAGTLILKGGIGYGGTTTVSTGELVLQGTSTANQLITVGENGTLTIDADANCTLVKGIQGNGILNLKGTLTMAASACQTLPGSSELSDGENGFAAASILVVGECGTINVGDAASLIIDGTSYSGEDIYVSDGKVGVLSGAGVKPYYVNTEVTYDAETMASATEFLIRSTGVLTTGDAGVLSKVKATESGATVRLDGSGATMTIAAQSTYTGEVVIASGTTVALTNATGLGVNYINNKNRSIIVEDGATLEYTADMYYKLVLQEGATLYNKSVNSGTGMMQNPYIELQGDATVKSDNLFGMRFGGGDATASETLALNGHTLTKTGSGTFFLYKTTLTAGTIDVQEGTLAFEAEGTGCSGTENVDIKLQSGAKFLVKQNGKGMRSLTLYGTGNSAQVEITGSNVFTINGMTTAEVLLEKIGSGTLKLNAATLAAGAKVTDGTLTLQGATSLGSVLTIENGKYLTVNDGVVVTLSGLSGFKEINSSGTIPTTNGLVEGSTYKIVDDKNATNYDNRLTKVTYQGSEYTLDDQGCIAVGAKIFYVVEAGADKVVTVGGNSATAQTADATEFYVGENGTLNMVGQANNTMTVGKMLTSTAGSGTIIYAAGTNTLTNGSRTVFAGDLEIAADSKLALGSSATDGATSAADVNISSLNSIILNGGTLFTRGVTGNLGNVISKAGSTGSVLTIFDLTGNNGVASGSVEIEKLELNADLKLACNWKSNINISKLTGAGKLTVERGNGDTVNIEIDSFGGFTGSMEIGANAKTTNVAATLKQGESLEASKITLHNTSMTLAGSGTFKLGSATALQQGLTLASSWAGTVEITDASITETQDLTALNSNAGSQLSIKGLTVADGAALSLDGAVTLGGTVTAAESIANAGALTFASDLQLDLTGMSATAGANGVNVITLLTGAGTSNLSSLTADALTSATKQLGTDWQFNADGTISYKTIAEELYWEGGDANWSSDGWSKVDGENTNLIGFASGSNVYFTNQASTISVNENVTVRSMTVSGAAYTFSGNGIITASELEIGTGATATFTYGKLNLGALSELTVDGTMKLLGGSTVVSTADLTSLVKLATGAGRLEVKGHNGAPEAYMIAMDDTALTQGIGTLYVDGYYGISGGNVVGTTTSYTIGAGKTMEVAGGKCVRIQQGAKLVLDGGTLTGKNASSYIQMGGDVNTTDNAYGHIEIKNGGTLSIGYIENKGGGLKNTLFMSGGVLELTGADKSISGISTTITGGTVQTGNNSWSITGSVTDGVHSVSIGSATFAHSVAGGTGVITLNTVKLTSALTVTGNVKFAGSITLAQDYTPAATKASHYVKEDGTTSTSGYRVVDTKYSLSTDAAGTITEATGTTWSALTSSGTLTDGVFSSTDKTVTFTSETTEYWVRDDKDASTTVDVTYAKTDDEFNDATKLVVDGGVLQLTTGLGDKLVGTGGDGIVLNGSGTIDLAGTGVTLQANQVSKAQGASGTTYLTGTGVYDLGTVTNLGTGEGNSAADLLKVTLVENTWAGTVKLSGTVAGVDLDDLATTNSVVELAGVSGSVTTGETGTHLILSKDGEANGFEVTSSSGETYTFNKGVSGEGDFYVTSTNSGDTYKFAGDLSGWTGSFKVGDGAGSQNVVINSTEETVAVNLNRNGNTLNATLEGTTGISMTGTLDVSKLTVNVDTSFTGTVTTAELVNTSTTSVVNDLSLTSLSNTGALTATGKSITVTGSAEGTGSITAGALTLQGSENTLGALTLTGNLTLGTADATSSLSATSLTMGADSSVVFNKLGSQLLTVGTLNSALNLSIEDALLEEMIQGAITSLDLMTLENIGGYALSLNGESAGYGVADNQYMLTLERDTTTGVVTLVVASQGAVWNGTDSTWSEDGNWVGSAVPGTDESVVFNGRGSSTVVVEGEISVDNLTFSTDPDLADPVTEYTLGAGTGESLLEVGSNLAVNNGSAVNIKTEVDVTNNTRIANGAELTVGEGGVLTSQNGIENKGTFNNNAEGKLTVGKDIINNGTFTSAGEIEVHGAVVNTDTLTVTGGTVNIGTVGTADTVTSLDNDGTLSVSGGEVTINGSVDNDGSLSVSGGEVTINGSVDNTNGTIIVGSTGGTASSLTVSGSLTGTGSADNLKVEKGSSLAVGDDLDATDVELEFSGQVTVGGNATVDKLTIGEEASFMAANATIGEVTNNGSLSVGSIDATTSELMGGELHIGSLSGTGNVTIGKDGVLEIGSMTEFSGQLSGEGEFSTGDNGLVLETKQNGASSITAKSLEISEAANGSNIAGTLATDEIIIEKLSGDTTSPLLAAETLQSKSANGKTTIVLSEVENKAVNTTSTTHLLSIENAMPGTVADNFDLSRYGYDETGAYDAESVAVQSEYMQTLLGKGLIVRFADSVSELSLLAAGGTSDLYAQVDEQTVEEATWDVSGETTQAGYIVGTKTGDSVELNDATSLDNVQAINVSEDVTLDLTGMSDVQLNDVYSENGNTLTLKGGGSGTATMNAQSDLAEGASLVVDGTQLEITGTKTQGLDAVTVQNASAVTVTGNVVTESIKLADAGSVLENSGGTVDTVALNGTGKLKGSLNIVSGAASQPGNFTGSYEDATVVMKGGKQTLTPDTGLTVSGSRGTASLKYDNYAMMDAIDTTGATIVLDRSEGAILQLTKASNMNSGEMHFEISGEEIASGPVQVIIGALDMSQTRVVISTEASGVLDVSSMGDTLVQVGEGISDEVVVELQGGVFDKYFSNATMVDGAVKVQRNTSYYSDTLSADTKNGQAGLSLANAALLNLNPQVTNPEGALAAVLSEFDSIIDGTSSRTTDDLGAALAGASTAALGMAAHGDVDRQLQAIRNRTTTMGVDQSVVHDDMPYFNAWINAEGSLSDLSNLGTEAGYKLNSWGGTVGFDVDFSPTFTAGMALTAMYGNLSVTGADRADGELNSYYVSAFARYCASAWTHTFVATVGITDLELGRNVLGYGVKGTTSGMSFGLMYEVGHVFALNEDATACLQPVFNITWRHTGVSGYHEKGSDVALNVDSQTLDTVTLGLGARMQAVVGESVYNRTSIFEARVLAKFDIGDRRSSTNVSLAGMEAGIESAELGAIGLEAGAGLTIPLGDDGGNLFMDAAVEMRADYMNVNGTIGYRINF